LRWGRGSLFDVKDKAGVRGHSSRYVVVEGEVGIVGDSVRSSVRATLCSAWAGSGVVVFLFSGFSA
jgi:hypothetical protein